MSPVFRLHEWCLHPREQGVYGDAAIRQAVARGEAILSFDAHLFTYLDTELEDGGHLLSLTPLPRGDDPNPLNRYRAEQRVPPPLSHWDVEDRERLVWVLAHSLFGDAAVYLLMAGRHVA